MNLQSLFNTVAEATISGTVVGIILFILKSTILRKLAAKWQYSLWSVMIIKLILPKGPESKISIFNQINVAEKITETEFISTVYKPQLIINIPQFKSTFEIADIIPYIWITGVAIASLWIVFSFIILKYKIYSSSSAASENTVEILSRCKNIAGINKNIRIVVQKHIPTTSLYGLIHPKILITNDFEKADINHLEYTFIHELSHYKRGDVFANYLLLFLQCIHWFNPVIWFLFRKIRRDTELATDERTMLYIQPNEHKSYGMALINTLSLHTARAPKLLGIANNKNDIKKRIKAISKFKRPNFIHNISGIITLMCTAAICLTSAAAAKPISDAIYNNLPKIDVTSIDESTVKFGKHTYDNKKTYQQETEYITEYETIVEEKKSTEFERIEDIVIIEDTNRTIDLNEYATTISYNTDYNGIHKVKVKPDSLGLIQLLIENKGSYNHMVKIGISNIETIGYGWDYQFTTEGKTPIYLDGYDPNEEYFITIDCYCPGHYNINGTILIY